MGILKEIFGPSRDECWQQLCTQIDADFVEGGWFKGSKVQAQHGQWMITLDTYTVSNKNSSTTYTRMRAPYVNPDGFRFTIYRKSFFSDIGKCFGMQDIEVGFPSFDDPFIIKGNDELKVRALFKDEHLRNLISQQHSFRMEVWDDEGFFGADYPKGVDLLRFSVVGVIRDIERLKSLYVIYAEVLNRLCHLGSAYHDDPNVRL